MLLYPAMVAENILTEIASGASAVEGSWKESYKNNTDEYRVLIVKCMLLYVLYIIKLVNT